MSDHPEVPNTHKPTIVFEGPAAFHDMACACCHTRPAVFHCNDGVFGPCWKCQETWKLTRKTWIDRLIEWKESK